MLHGNWRQVKFSALRRVAEETLASEEASYRFRSRSGREEPMRVEKVLRRESLGALSQKRAGTSFGFAQDK